jgi:hypothetical protein
MSLDFDTDLPVINFLYKFRLPFIGYLRLTIRDITLKIEKFLKRTIAETGFLILNRPTPIIVKTMYTLFPIGAFPKLELTNVKIDSDNEF